MKARDKRDLRNRVLSVHGHIAAIIELMARDAPCADIVRQTLAVRGAMDASHRALGRAYLFDQNCGLRARNGKKHARAWQELRALMDTEQEE